MRTTSLLTLVALSILLLTLPSPAVAQAPDGGAAGADGDSLLAVGEHGKQEVICEAAGGCGDPPGGGGGGGGGGGSCTPNYQVVNVGVLGAFQVNYYSPVYCEHVAVEELTWHDQNNCPDSSDYTTCRYRVTDTRPDHFCCYYLWCGGQTSC